jgi:hypothetical protein
MHSSKETNAILNAAERLSSDQPQSSQDPPSNLRDSEQRSLRPRGLSACSQRRDHDHGDCDVPGEGLERQWLDDCRHA